MFLGILISLHVLISILLIFVIVVLQSGKGESLAGAIGGGIGSTVGGKKGATALTKFTSYLAVAFMGLALVIGILSTNVETSSSDGPGKALQQIEQMGIVPEPAEEEQDKTEE